MRIFLLLLFVVLCNVPNYSQDTTYYWDIDNPYVKWVAQFPSIKKKKERFGKKLLNVLIGKKSMEIQKPFSVVAKNPEDFWIIEQGNNRLFWIEKSENKTPRLIKNIDIDFKSLVQLCYIGEKDLLFTDSYLNKIYRTSFEKKKLEVLNDSLKLERPTGIAWSSIKNEIWVVETGKHRVSVLDNDGSLKYRFGKRGNGTAEFNFPTFITIDKNGYVYIIDSMNFRIQIFKPDGSFLRTFGEYGAATGYFSRPKGVAVDSHGNIYIADALFHVVQIFDPKGNYLYSFGEQGQGKGQFWMPTGIFIDRDDNIYIADSYNSRIQVFKLIKYLNNK